MGNDLDIQTSQCVAWYVPKIQGIKNHLKYAIIRRRVYCSPQRNIEQLRIECS